MLSASRDHPTSSTFSTGNHLMRPRPFPNSYWATPLLVACEYPWTPTRAQRSQKLDLLLRAGVRTFIDLTESGELSPYAPHLSAHVARVSNIEQRDVEYHSFPIPDRCLPCSESYVRQILDVLRDNERRGRIAAVHCRGGPGSDARAWSLSAGSSSLERLRMGLLRLDSSLRSGSPLRSTVDSSRAPRRVASATLCAISSVSPERWWRRYEKSDAPALPVPFVRVRRK
jgi:hypothetical protein